MRTAKRLLFVGSSVAILLLGGGTLALVADGLRDHVGHADVALVLGNTVQPDGTPSPRLRARLDKTLELYRAGYFPAVIASGGPGKEGFDEAIVMKDYLLAGGIPQEQIIVDSNGLTTFLSAKHTRTMMHQRKLASVFVVSQYFHVPRVRLALQRFGITTVYSAHARFFERRDLYSIPRELVGYLRYWWRSYDVADGAESE